MLQRRPTLQRLQPQLPAALPIILRPLAQAAHHPATLPHPTHQATPPVGPQVAAPHLPRPQAVVPQVSPYSAYRLLLNPAAFVLHDKAFCHVRQPMRKASMHYELPAELLQQLFIELLIKSVLKYGFSCDFNHPVLPVDPCVCTITCASPHHKYNPLGCLCHLASKSCAWQDSTSVMISDWILRLDNFNQKSSL